MCDKRKRDNDIYTSDDNKRTKLPDNEPTNIEKLGAALECQICKETIVTPYLLYCSHSHCKKCTFELFTTNTHECPTCHKKNLKPACVDKHSQHFLDIYLETKDAQEKEKYRKRVAESEQYFEAQFEKFKNIIKTATEKGVTFLNIENQWTEKQKLTFRIGMERYEGKELELYCKLTNFTVDFIDNATLKQLVTVAKNLDTRIPRYGNMVNVKLLRKVLKDILYV